MEKMTNKVKNTERGRFFSSWSGGKDSCLAFFKAKEAGFEPSILFTALDSDGISTRAHGFEKDIVEKQAEMMGVDIYTVAAGWGKYEGKLLEFMKMVKSKGVDYGVFGDIDLESHRVWLENICKKADIKPIFPLWNMEREKVVKEFLENGFKTRIAACKKEYRMEDLLGKDLNFDTIEELKKRNIDVAGENGEFHTIVYSGPIFIKNIEIEECGTVENEKNIIKKYRVK